MNIYISISAYMCNTSRLNGAHHVFVGPKVFQPGILALNSSTGHEWNTIPTVEQPFPGSSIPRRPKLASPNEGGSQNSKIAAYKLELPVSWLSEMLETKFQRIARDVPSWPIQ